MQHSYLSTWTKGLLVKSQEKHNATEKRSDRSFNKIIWELNWSKYWKLCRPKRCENCEKSWEISSHIIKLIKKKKVYKRKKKNYKLFNSLLIFRRNWSYAYAFVDWYCTQRTFEMLVLISFRFYVASLKWE